MAKLTWSEQYRHPQWQKKRLEALEAAGWQCVNCGTKETTLNVHHTRYVRGRSVWEYEISELRVLCEECHLVKHQDLDFLNTVLAEYGDAPAMAAGLTGGYLDANCMMDSGIAEMARQLMPMHYELGVAAACLESLGREEWRKVVRRAADGRHTTPTIKRLIELWDQKNK